MHALEYWYWLTFLSTRKCLLIAFLFYYCCLLDHGSVVRGSFRSKMQLSQLFSSVFTAVWLQPFLLPCMPLVVKCFFEGVEVPDFYFFVVFFFLYRMMHKTINEWPRWKSLDHNYWISPPTKFWFNFSSRTTAHVTSRFLIMWAIQKLQYSKFAHLLPFWLLVQASVRAGAD